MSNVSKRLYEEKRIMQRQIEELNKKEKQLKVEMETLHKSVAHLDNLREEIKSGITQQRLKEIVTELDMKVRVNFLSIILVKYFVLKNLDKQQRNTNLLLHHIPNKMKQIESARKNVNTCPDCDGVGFHVQRRYLRENGNVTPHFKSNTCPLCYGKGRINLDETV